MSRLPNPRNWHGQNPSKLLTTESTPSATAVLLCKADQYVLDAATVPYAGCGRVFNGAGALDGSGESPGTTVFDGNGKRYIRQVVAPGAAHMRGSITGLSFDWGIPLRDYHESWTNTGGTTGTDIVKTLDVITDNFVFQFGRDATAEILDTGAGGVDPAPAVAIDREYELQSLPYPYVETLMVRWAFAFSSWVSGQVADLESL